MKSTQLLVFFSRIIFAFGKRDNNIIKIKGLKKAEPAALTLQSCLAPITKRPRGQRGAGLIEVLIMSGVMLMLVMFMMQSFSNFNKFQKHKKIQLNELFLRSYINDSVDCDQTLSNLGGSCSSVSQIEIASNSETEDILVKLGNKSSNDYTKIGDFQVRAFCLKNGKIKLQKRLVGKQNQPVKHPLHNTAKWTPLYKNIDFKCSVN